MWKYLKDGLLFAKNAAVHFYNKKSGKNLTVLEKIKEIKNSNKDKDVIITIKGIHAARYGMHSIEKYFLKKNKAVIHLDYSSGDITDEAVETFMNIYRVKEELPNHSLYIIAHSKGGLVLMETMRIFHTPEIIKKAVLLGSPLKEMDLPLAGKFGLVDKKTMRGNKKISEFLKENTLKTFSNITSIAGSADIIVPPSYSAVPGIKTTFFPDVGHLGLIENRKVLSYIYDCFFFNQ